MCQDLEICSNNMQSSSTYLESLIKEFSKLPGIGSKSASRLAFHLLTRTNEEVEKLSNAITELKKNIKSCTNCGGIADADYCSICMDSLRDSKIICIVEGARDVLTIENTREFKGEYHVLNGLISPLDGVGPDELNIAGLLVRCKNNDINEIILALNPIVEGDATSLYISKLISPLGIKVSRIAHADQNHFGGGDGLRRAAHFFKALKQHLPSASQGAEW